MAMAPTRSPGLMPSSLPAPIYTLAIPGVRPPRAGALNGLPCPSLGIMPPVRPRGSPMGRRPIDGRSGGLFDTAGISISFRSPPCMRNTSFIAAAATSMGSPWPAQDAATARNRSRSPAASTSSIAPLVRASRFVRRSATVGTGVTTILAFVSCSIFHNNRCSRGSSTVIAAPSLPARPVRPIRWT